MLRQAVLGCLCKLEAGCARACLEVCCWLPGTGKYVRGAAERLYTLYFLVHERFRWGPTF